MRRTFATLLTAIGLLAAPVPANAATPTTLLQAIGEEASYIHSMYRGDGVIATVPTKDAVNPYQANFAAMGLARAYSVLRDNRYSTVMWRWLEWYRDHMLADGTMPNWKFVGRWEQDGIPDSTDSYAGTYLSAILEAFRATGDLNRLAALKPAVNKAIGAIELTEDDDGLHFARPGWPFKYTMDEAEAYAGFRAAEQIGMFLRDDALRARARNNADRLLAGSANLIDPTTGLYLWGIHDDGTKVHAPISWIYPGASAQVWAVADGLATGVNARTLMERVEQAQPQWDDPVAMTQWYDGLCGYAPCIKPVGYWPRFAMGWLAVGDARRALTGALSVRSGAIRANRAYPFGPSDSGQIIMVLADADVMAATMSPVALPMTPL